jgi:hypothetical protein
LIVSAFPNDYIPTPTSLIGGLHRNGVSVAELAKQKAADLRRDFGCWLSGPIPNTSSSAAPFKRILCFEPGTRGAAPEVISGIFQALAPFLFGRPDSTDAFSDATVAMPMVATGDQGWRPEEILPPLLDAAAHWLSRGLPLKCLKIVERSPKSC